MYASNCSNLTVGHSAGSQQPRLYTAAFVAIGFFIKPFNILICAALLLFDGPARGA